MLLSKLLVFISCLNKEVHVLTNSTGEGDLVIVNYFFSYKASGESTSEDQERPLPSSVSKLENISDQESEINIEKVSHSAPLASSVGFSEGSGKNVVRSRKLGLGTKRKGLAEYDVNCKGTKMS